MELLNRLFSRTLNSAEYDFTNPQSRIAWFWCLFYLVLGFLIVKWQLRGKGGKNPFRALFPRAIYGSPSFWLDLKVYAANLLGITAILLALGIYGPQGVRKATYGFVASIANGSLNGYLTNGPLVDLAFSVCLLIVKDFTYYVFHYFHHRVPFLWRFHRVHHSATSLNPMTNFRFHPVESAFSRICIAVAVGATTAIFYQWFGVKPTILSLGGFHLMTLLFTAVDNFNHSHIWLSYGKFEHIFYSPAMHHIHHSRDREHYDKNLGFYFSIWDIIFGTFQKAGLTPQKIDYGLNDGKDWDRAGVLDIYLCPFVDRIPAISSSNVELCDPVHQKGCQEASEDRAQTPAA